MVDTAMLVFARQEAVVAAVAFLNVYDQPVASHLSSLPLGARFRMNLGRQTALGSVILRPQSRT
jgi:hypothetical protein